MKPYRISIKVDIVARDDLKAQRRAMLLYSDLELRAWVQDVLPDGIEERQWVHPPRTRG